MVKSPMRFSPKKPINENGSPLKTGLAAFGSLQDEDENDDFALSLSSVQISTSMFTAQDSRRDGPGDDAAKENEVMQRLTNKISAFQQHFAHEKQRLQQSLTTASDFYE